MVIGTVSVASARRATVGRVSFDLFSKAEKVWEHIINIILTMSKLLFSTANTLRILQGARSPCTWGQVA